LLGNLRIAASAEVEGSARRVTGKVAICWFIAAVVLSTASVSFGSRTVDSILSFVKPISREL